MLRELAQLKGLGRAPENLLPLPKNELMVVLQQSTHPGREQLIRMLDMFDPQPAQAQLFLARLVTRPAVLTLAYTVAIAVQGASWWWVPWAFLGGVGASSRERCGHGPSCGPPCRR